MPSLLFQNYSVLQYKLNSNIIIVFFSHFTNFFTCINELYVVRVSVCVFGCVVKITFWKWWMLYQCVPYILIVEMFNFNSNTHRKKNKKSNVAHFRLFQWNVNIELYYFIKRTIFVNKMGFQACWLYSFAVHGFMYSTFNAMDGIKSIMLYVYYMGKKPFRINSRANWNIYITVNHRTSIVLSPKTKTK